MQETLDLVEDGHLLEEFGGCINVEIDSVIEAFNLASVARPDDKSEMVEISLFMRVEELWKATDLFVVLFIQTLFYDLVHKI